MCLSNQCLQDLQVTKKVAMRSISLRKQPSLLVPCCWGLFARRDVCASATSIPYWLCKICQESGQELWLVDAILCVYCFSCVYEWQRKNKRPQNSQFCGMYSSVDKAFKKFAVSSQKNTKFYQNRPEETLNWTRSLHLYPNDHWLTCVNIDLHHLYGTAVSEEEQREEI